MAYIAKQDFLWYHAGDEVPEKEVKENDWDSKQLVEIVKHVSNDGELSVSEFSSLSASEQKDILKELGVEPESNIEKRAKQYEDLV